MPEAADSSGAVVVAVGSNESLWVWQVCPSLGTCVVTESLCVLVWGHCGQHGEELGQRCGPCCQGSGFDFKACSTMASWPHRGATLQRSQLVRSCSSSWTRSRWAKPWTESSEFQSCVYGDVHPHEEIKCAGISAVLLRARFECFILVPLSAYDRVLENTYITNMQIQCLIVNSLFLSLRAFITMPATSDNQIPGQPFCFFPVC